MFEDNDGLTWENWKRCFLSLFLTYAALVIAVAFAYVAWKIANILFVSGIVGALQEVLLWPVSNGSY